MMFRGKKSKASTSSTQPLKPQSLKLSDIVKATKNFDKSLMIASGGFGNVYKGVVSINGSKEMAAIKRWSRDSKQGDDEFWAEVNLVSKLAHQNIVPLLGYCTQNQKDGRESSPLHPRPRPPVEKELILVYRYMPEGTLTQLLHTAPKSPLSWLHRLEICMDVAKGIEYMHNSSESGILHRDLKTSNILLDKNGVAKISDFGLSESCELLQQRHPAKGTFGFLDPAYLGSGIPTLKSDVYSFGVILLELVCRKHGLDPVTNTSLVLLYKESITDRNFEDLIDREIVHEVSPECFEKIIELANGCLDLDPTNRYDMRKVRLLLHNILSLQKEHNTRLRLAPTIGEISADVFPGQQGFKEYTYDDIKKATGEFRDCSTNSENNVKVYAGWVDKDTLSPSNRVFGIRVAVVMKLKGNTTQDDDQEEVDFLKDRHPNVIKLLGCYSQENLRYLVYEYLEKSLSDFTQRGEIFPWTTRLNVVKGVARGMEYLCMTKGIICQFGCDDILLDQNFQAQIGGFGWTRHAIGINDSHRIDGTFGYLKAYDIRGDLLRHNDICSFGYMLLEAITGKPSPDIDRRFLDRLDGLVKKVHKTKSLRKKLKKIMDPRLHKDGFPREDALKCISIALDCIGDDKPQRPDIVSRLEELAGTN